MSSTDNYHDVEIPEDDVMTGDEVETRRSGMSPGKKIMLLSTVSIVIVAALMFSVGTGPSTAPSDIRPPPNIDATPGGSNQENSALYQQSVREMNEAVAQRATDRGVSSMPTPESILEPIVPVDPIETVTIEDMEPEPEPAPPPRERRILPRPEPVPQPVAPQPAPAPDQAAEEVSEDGKEPENPYIASIGGMMQATAKSFAPRPMSSISITRSNPAPQVDDAVDIASAETCENCDNQRGFPGEQSSTDLPMLRPGDVLYAETMTKVNSDIDASVIAEVVAGPYKGSRLVGGFETDPGSGRMIVKFSAMSLPDGTSMGISALAVDGRTAETTVRSDIERRYVQRYGPVLAASFIGSYARAISQPKQTIVDMGESTQVITESPTKDEAVAAGVSAGLGAIASDIQSYAPRGPKIILRDGWPLGVMILAPTERLSSGVGAGVEPGSDAAQIADLQAQLSNAEAALIASEAE